MNLFFFTVAGPDADEHMNDTIINGFSIGEHMSDLDSDLIELLRREGSLEKVKMWGAIPGKQNVLRWKSIERGDRVLVYRDGKFIYFGTIFAKTRSKTLAEAAWGTNGGSKRGEPEKTWECIYFLKNIRPVDIRFIDFAKSLGYSFTYPRGFFRVESSKIKRWEEVFGSVDSAIEYLSNSELPRVLNEFAEMVGVQGEREIEESTAGMTEKEFVDYIYKLNPKASIKTIEGLTKIRKYNIKLIDKLKELYQQKCQICGSTSVEKYGVSVVEGHHIEYFSLSQNNSPDNILILCPDHHRLIHKAKGKFDPKKGEVVYSNGFVEKLAIDLHINAVRKKKGKEIIAAD